jgi:hypothetical protein
VAGSEGRRSARGRALNGVQSIRHVLGHSRFDEIVSLYLC